MNVDDGKRNVLTNTKCFFFFRFTGMTTILTSTSLRSIGDLYGYYVGLLNLSLGLLGNTMIILVFINVKVFRGNQCSFYFIVESFSNLGLLLVIYSARVFQAVFGYDPNITYLSWCRIRSTFAQIFGLCSLFTICLYTFYQYLATNHRCSLRQLSLLKLAHRLVLFSMCFVTGHSMLFAIYVEIRPTMGCTVYHSIVKRYCSFVYYPILSTALPLFVTVSFSLLAYDNVRRIIRRQVSIVRRRLDRQTTALVLTRVLCIVICGLPYICVTLYGLNLNNNQSDDLHLAIVALIGAVAYSLLYTNFCVSQTRYYASDKYLCFVDQFLHLPIRFVAISPSGETFSFQTMLSVVQTTWDDSSCSWLCLSTLYNKS